MITRDYSDKDLRAALGSSPPLEKMKMTLKKQIFADDVKSVDDVSRQLRNLSDRLARITGFDDGAPTPDREREELIFALGTAVMAWKSWVEAQLQGTKHFNDAMKSVGDVEAVYTRAKASHGAGT